MKQLINFAILLIVYNHQTLIAAFSLEDPVKFFSSSLNHNGIKNTGGYGDPYPRTTTTTTTRAPTTEPAIPEDYFRCPQKTGQFPHPRIHSQYYICQDYEPMNRVCPYLFLYDISTKRCEHEDIAKCVKVPHPLRGGLDAFEGIDENYRCLHEGVYPHETDCDRYYSCVHEVAYVYQCYTKLFDIRLNGCNYAELTDCGGRKRPSDLPGTITPPPTTVPPTTPIYGCPPNSQDYRRDPYDCTAYYYCTYGTPRRLFCQDGGFGKRLHFDEARQLCDHPVNVNCTALPIN